MQHYDKLAKAAGLAPSADEKPSEGGTKDISALIAAEVRSQFLCTIMSMSSYCHTFNVSVPYALG